MQSFAAPMSVNTERRKNLRNRPRSLVYVELEYANGGMMCNLSEEGFAVRAEKPLRPGGKTQFAFSLEETSRISGEGRIVWVKEDGRLAGIEFCGLPRKDREQIREWFARAGLPAARDSEAPAAGVPEPPARETPREDARSPLSSVLLPPIGAAETLQSPEPGMALLEPLPELQPESEFREKPAARVATRFPMVRAIVMMLLLILIASAVVYRRQVGQALVRLGQIVAGHEEMPPPQTPLAGPPAQITPVPETAAPAAAPSAAERSAPASPGGEGSRTSAAQAAAGSKASETPPSLPATPSSSAKVPRASVPAPTAQENRLPAPGGASATAGDNGQQEYQQAEQIMGNRSSEAELPVAVRLLWAAVEKGNADAEVALAELYREGKGVPRNCDQARILLSAAARKGSAEAQKHLEELKQGNCP
jgi:hypothetical protein